MAKVDILISTNGTATEFDIINSPGNGGAGVSNGDFTAPSHNDSSVVSKSIYANQLATAGINALKSAFNFAKSSYGNFTGDYIGQQKIDNIMSVANTLVSFGSTVASGATVGGVPGAIVGAVVGAINIGVDAWQNNVDYNLSIEKSNYQTSFNSIRIGRILNDGSR